jgi:DNA-binding LacI/PurR family transcriptional regulator
MTTKIRDHAQQLNLSITTFSCALDGYRDVTVASYEGIKEREFSKPLLTTLYAPTCEIAMKLSFMLIALVNGETFPEMQVKIQPELIVRASTR